MIRLVMGLAGVGMSFMLAGCNVEGVEFKPHGMVAAVPVLKMRDNAPEWDRTAEEVKMWRKAVAQGAPVYRAVSCGAEWCKDLPVAPLSAAIRHTQHGMVLAVDDVEQFGRWYGVVSYPAMRLDLFEGVQYVYEAVGAKLVKTDSGAVSVAVSIHEKRSGCALPACDPNPQTGLPNYERTWDRTPENLSVRAEAFKGHQGTGKGV